MPVPRKFDRRPPERDLTRINDRIRVPEVRLIGDDGKQIGVIKIADALQYAQERDLDLVEVAPEARPPVCRALDYSKYKYEQAQKQKAARRHQQQITIREIKFRPKIAQNDYDTKKGHVQRFLLNKDKVKITIMFRGREVTHPERGVALLEKLAEELGEVAIVEQSPLHDGRNMTMMLSPSKAVLAGEKDGAPAEKPAQGATKALRRAAAAEAAEAAADHAPAAADDTPPEADGTPAEAEETTAEADDTTAEADATPAAAEETAAEAPAAAEPVAPAEDEAPVAPVNGTRERSGAESAPAPAGR